MLKGIFVNKTGMIAQQRRLDIAANNLANLNTAGFKKERIFFRQLLEAMADPLAPDANRTPGNTGIDLRSGSVQPTGNPLDVAINGEGFFVVENDAGLFYTRAGRFEVDLKGRLVTPEGHVVQSDAGEVIVEGDDAHISDAGDIIIDGELVARLRIVTVDQPQLLEKVGSTYFRLGEAVEMPLAEPAVLKAGFLEFSNVNPMLDMVEMIELNRHYELGQKVIEAQDDTLDRLINQAGRL